MSDRTFVIVFSPDFSDDDIAVHVALCREHSPDLLVFFHVLRTMADVDTLRHTYDTTRALAVWNLYMEVDAISERLLAVFGRQLVGVNHEITSKTYRKSITYRALEKFNLPRLWSVSLTTPAEIAALCQQPGIPFPVIVKVDQGYNCLGLTAECICGDSPSLGRQAIKIMDEFGQIVVQQFLPGREFTVAVANGRAFKPVEKVFQPGQLVYLPDVPYQQRDCPESALDAQLRVLAERTARAFGVGKTEYCRIDFRQNPQDGLIFPIDINDMCSVWPNSQFERSLSGDGARRSDLIGWLATPASYVAARSRITVFLIWHADLSQLENVLPFLQMFDCKVFLYAWNESRDVMADYFASQLGLTTLLFNIDTFMDALERETRRVVVLFTSSLNYPFGGWMKQVFTTIQAHQPKILDVASVGHCVDHSSCSSCRSDMGRIPLKMTAWMSGRLPYGDREVAEQYQLSPKTILVSPTTGDDDIVLADLELLHTLKRLQDAGRFEFLFKLHPSTVMMQFDGVYFQREKAGYDFVRAHFRIVSMEHFSIFPFAGQIAVHITDLFSSMPAVLTYLGDRVILAKDNPAVAADHPIRPFLHVFQSAVDLEALLDRVATLGALNNGAFQDLSSLPARGDEDMQVAAERGWLAPDVHVHAPPAPGWRDAVHAELAQFRAEIEEKHGAGEIDDEGLADALSALGVWMPADAA